MIKVLEIVIVNLGFIIKFHINIRNVKIHKRVKLVFSIQVIHEVVTTIQNVASQIFASWFYVLFTRSH